MQIETKYNGLKQASVIRYRTIPDVFVDQIKFKYCFFDACIFVRKHQEGSIFIALYVDDMRIAAKSRKTIQTIQHHLQNCLD